MTGRRTSLVVSMAAALLLVGAAAVWACTEQAHITIYPREGPPQTEVTVDGNSFVDGGRVEIRWDTSNGRLLGTDTGSNFSTRVTIPGDADDRVYSVVAVGYDKDGEVAGQTSAQFQVTSSAPGDRSGDGQPEGNEETGSQQTTAGDAQSDSSGGEQSSTESSESSNNSTDQQSTGESSDEFAQASNRDGQGTRDSSQDQQSTGERSNDGGAAADGEQQPTGQADAGQQPDTSQQPQAGTDQQSSSSPNQPTPDRAPQGSSSTQPSTADQSAGEAPTTGQGAGDGGGEPDEVAEQSTEGRQGTRRPSDASPFGTLQPAALHDASMLQRIIAPTDQTDGAATGDLWSGLNSSSAPTTGLGDAPSAAQQPHSADQQLLAVGAGAVATGLMLLAGGALLIAVRRRSVPATRHPRA